MGILDLFRRFKLSSPDQMVITQLQKAGSNLAKPHAIEFFLYFPTESSAKQASSRIREAGFQSQVKKAAQGDTCLCFATKEMVPTEDALETIRNDFDSLATSLGGEYDGWGSPVVP
jgi:regulator of RNase E activity RraB